MSHCTEFFFPCIVFHVQTTQKTVGMISYFFYATVSLKIFHTVYLTFQGSSFQLSERETGFVGTIRPQKESNFHKIL